MSLFSQHSLGFIQVVHLISESCSMDCSNSPCIFSSPKIQDDIELIISKTFKK